MKTYVTILISVLISLNSYSQSNCSPATSSTDLDIGNVRAKILMNGDMWWDLSGTAKYEVPKGSGKNSLFAGALWFGGKDIGGNLKLSAQTYRQSGSDFWPGAIDTSAFNISAARCLHYDQHWKITRQEVSDFINGGSPTPAITNWPGNGDGSFGEVNLLAPFYDRSGDGVYDINDGDYPKYEFGVQSNNMYDRLNGDQTIWWVFNDIGNVHMETGGSALGLEIQAQAYAFCTNDSDLQNTTFYSFKIINRSPNSIYNTFIGNWTDVDLGYSFDDYVGCDVGRNLGYAYNGDNLDEGVTGYGTVIPAVGIDLLGGPLADQLDGLDNDHDSLIDEQDETIVMTGFLYYNNDASLTGNPSTTSDYYNYMNMIWKNGLPVTYGGTGYDPVSTDSCLYMFPGDSDPNFYGTKGINYGFNWTEKEPTPSGAPNNPSDRRFLMNTGNFTMLPGQVQYFTKAAVWAISAGGPDSSLAALKRADDRIQSFFDSNFNNIPTCDVNAAISEIDRSTYSIGPNPVSDKLFLKSHDEKAKLKLTVFSPAGKLILKDADFNSSVSVSGWSAGIYLYRVTDQNGNHSQGKLTVIHD